MPTDHLIGNNKFRSRLSLDLNLYRSRLFCDSIVIDSIDRVRLCLIVMSRSIEFKIRSISYLVAAIVRIVIARSIEYLLSIAFIESFDRYD